MKHKLRQWIWRSSCAALIFCTVPQLQAEPSAAPRNSKTSAGKIQPQTERKIPFGQQFNVNARIHALLEKLHQEDPAEYERLIKLRSENREEYLQELWKKMPERKNDNRQKIAETDRQCRELAGKFRTVDSEAEKAAIKAELSALLDQSMDLVIKDTRERLERIQKILNNLNENREKIKQQRMDDFLSGKSQQDFSFPPAAK